MKINPTWKSWDASIYRGLFFFFVAYFPILDTAVSLFSTPQCVKAALTSQLIEYLLNSTTLLCPVWYIVKKHEGDLDRNALDNIHAEFICNEQIGFSLVAW